MKTKEELSIRNYTVIEQRGGNNMSEEKLNELKEKVAGLQEELKELTPEEIEKVFGGVAYELSPQGVNVSWPNIACLN